jgi:hypothetical protein
VANDAAGYRDAAGSGHDTTQVVFVFSVFVADDAADYPDEAESRHGSHA